MSSNEVISFSGAAGLPANTDDLIKGLQNVGQTLQASSGGTPFLRLLRNGTYAYGAESIEPEEDSLWAMNPNSVQHGWAAWGDGELLGEVMVPFTQAAPARGELPDYGVEWRQQVSIVLQCLNGDDEGVAVLYKGTSTGLHNAVKQLITDLVRQLQTDPQHCVPVIALEVDSYQHKKYGEIFYPVLTVTKWISFGGEDSAPETASEAADDAQDDSEPDEPAPRQRTAADAGGSRRGRNRGSEAKTAETDSEDAAPSGARRRRRRG